jgi:hypothetical protein
VTPSCGVRTSAPSAKGLLPVRAGVDAEALKWLLYNLEISIVLVAFREHKIQLSGKGNGTGRQC